MRARTRRGAPLRQTDPRPAAGARARRGAVTVMAGVFMVALSIFGGMAVDATRVFTTRSEMQTMVDAAVMAGAIQMLRDSSTAGDSAIAYARRNGLQTRGDTPDESEVTTGVWQYSTRTFIENAEPADAIRFRLTHQMNFILAQAVGLTGLELSVTATAWSAAPVSRSNGCVKPIMLPYDFMRNIVQAPSSEMTPDDMRRIRELSEAERTDSFTFGDRDAQTSRSWYAVDLPPIYSSTDGTRREQSEGDYSHYMRECGRTHVGPGDWLLLMPDGERRAKTVQGVRDLCQDSVEDGGLGGNLVGGVCYVDGTATGIPVKVAFYDAQPQYGYFNVGAVQVKTVGSFVITKIDPELDPSTGRPHAKITGHLSTANDFGPVSNQPSTLRRAVIVE